MCALTDQSVVCLSLHHHAIMCQGEHTIQSAKGYICSPKLQLLTKDKTGNSDSHNREGSGTISTLDWLAYNSRRIQHCYAEYIGEMQYNCAGKAEILHSMLTFFCITQIDNNCSCSCEGTVSPVVVVFMVELALMILHHCTANNSSTIYSPLTIHVVLLIQVSLWCPPATETAIPRSVRLDI